ncbi:hypothetical protein ABGB16_24595 [Micromonospora sp. B11E3]|uniref:hypothetical protein n=1 Tax=Micromonospora sp. B11E3 TaxID=3153562 RepID=UPI00325EA6E9
MNTHWARPPARISAAADRAEDAAGRIAAAALDEIPDGGTIAVDAGAITARMVAMLPHGRAMIVVVNSPP